MKNNVFFCHMSRIPVNVFLYIEFVFLLAYYLLVFFALLTLPSPFIYQSINSFKLLSFLFKLSESLACNCYAVDPVNKYTSAYLDQLNENSRIRVEIKVVVYCTSVGSSLISTITDEEKAYHDKKMLKTYKMVEIYSFFLLQLYC